MQLNIPRLKDTLILIEDWSAEIPYEYRNREFLANLLQIKKLSYQEQSEIISRFYDNDLVETGWRGLRSNHPNTILIPAGTNLLVERIYIRQGASDFDSVTFRIPKNGCPINPNMTGRFWVKLPNANQIEYREP